MTNAIVALQMRLQVLETNEPVNRAEGNVDQADYERDAIAEIKQAIAVLVGADIERKRDAGTLKTIPSQPPEPLGQLWGVSVPVAVEVALDKALRRDVDEITQRAKALLPSRERSLAITKLQEAVMWLGMDLKRIGEANPGLVRDPYPNGKNADSPVIDNTADGLKM